MRNATLLLPMMLAACAQPFEGQVASRLAEAGLSRSMADCMAKRWVDKLSLAQLQKISNLAENLKEERGKLTALGFVTRVRQLDDPEIVQVVTSSSVVCALSG